MYAFLKLKLHEAALITASAPLLWTINRMFHLSWHYVLLLLVLTAIVQYVSIVLVGLLVDSAFALWRQWRTKMQP